MSQDPQFAKKVRDVVGLYLNPPDNAIVVSVDEKTQIQALQRTQRVLPLREGDVTRHTHDYTRHGVVDLYAALEIATGRVTHQTTDSHKTKDFLGFMKLVVSRYPDQELHVVLDNSSTHQGDKVDAWLKRHPKVHFHFTPTSASWLNQVEALFSILTRQSLTITNFGSKAALREHIQKYLRSWNANPTPFLWQKKANAIVRDHRRIVALMSHAQH